MPTPSEPLAAAARRYADYLTALPDDAGPRATEAVERYTGLVPTADAGPWSWAGFLTIWPTWRPHRLDRLLFGPDSQSLRTLAARCSTPGSRRRGLFGRSSPEPDCDDLLSACAAALSAAADPSPTRLDYLDGAAEIAREVDAAAAALPADWPAARLARAAGCLGAGWPFGPERPEVEFLPLLCHLLAEMTIRPTLPAAALFHAVIREALEDLTAADVVPSVAALDHYRSTRSPTGEEIIAAFAAVYAERGRGGPARHLATLGWRAAVEVAPDIAPRLDPVTLEVAAGYHPGEAAAVRFVVSPEPAGVVRGVVRFAIPPTPPEVEVSLGPNPPAGQALLTAPRNPDGLPAGPGREQLLAARTQSATAFRAGEADEPSDGWLAWAETPPGRDWFHALASTESADARAWLAALLTWSRNRCFPQADAGRFTWPDDVPLSQPGTVFRPDTAEPGTVVAVERFSTDPTAARFTVSTGPADDSPVGAAARLWEVVIQYGLAATGLGATASRLVEPVIRFNFAPTTAELIALLDALAALDPRSAPAAELSKILDCVREVAHTAAVEVLPVGWDYSSGMPFPAVPPSGLTARPVFRAAEPAGVMVRVRAFGLVREGGVIRPGEVVVSAGPVPFGLTDLEAAAEAAPGQEADGLRAGMKGLRAAGLGGYLEPAAVELYSLFWTRVYPEWAAADAPGAAGFADGLRQMLAETFGLAEFVPTNYRDYPDGWVRLPPGSRLTTGRVRRVISPGLADAAGRLRLPAQAEAE